MVAGAVGVVIMCVKPRWSKASKIMTGPSMAKPVFLYSYLTVPAAVLAIFDTSWKCSG